MKGTLHLSINTISGRTIIGDKNDIKNENEVELHEGIVALTSMIKAPNLTILTVQVNGITEIIRGVDISSVSVIGSTTKLNDLIWRLV